MTTPTPKPTDFFAEGDHLKSDDLGGQRHRVTIERIGYVTFPGRDGGADETWPQLHFLGRQKPLTLRRQNGKTLLRAYGDDFGAWIGKDVELEAVGSPVGEWIQVTIPRPLATGQTTF